MQTTQTDLTFSTCLVLSRVSSAVAGQIVKFSKIFFFQKWKLSDTGKGNITCKFGFTSFRHFIKTIIANLWTIGACASELKASCMPLQMQNMIACFNRLQLTCKVGSRHHFKTNSISGMLCSIDRGIAEVQSHV